MALNYNKTMSPSPQTMAPQTMPSRRSAPSMPNPMMAMTMGQGLGGGNMAKQNMLAQQAQFAPGMEQGQLGPQMQGYPGGMNKFGLMGAQQGSMVPPMAQPQASPMAGIPPQRGMPGQAAQIMPQTNPGFAPPQRANSAASFLRPQMQAPFGGARSGGFFGKRR